MTLRNIYGYVSGTIWLSDLHCTGYEASIDECVHKDWNVHNCVHSQDVAIVCGNGKYIQDDINAMILLILSFAVAIYFKDTN